MLIYTIQKCAKNIEKNPKKNHWNWLLIIHDMKTYYY